MKEQENKAIDALVDKMMKAVDLKSPSLDFTSHIMSQVEELSSSQVTRYKPLISKWVWAIIAIIVITVLGLSLNENTINNETMSWYSTIDFSLLYNNSISQFFNGITIPKTLLYSVVLFGAMLAIQIPLLKYYFNKRLEI